MLPQSPVINNLTIPEIVFAEDQPEYNNLPALKLISGEVITRWRLDWKERIKVLFKGNIYLSLLTFNQPLQPIRLEVDPPVIKIKNSSSLKVNSEFEEKLA